MIRYDDDEDNNNDDYDNKDVDDDNNDDVKRLKDFFQRWRMKDLLEKDKI